MPLRGILLLAATLIPAAGLGQAKAKGFVIDPSKPWAYLKFDHVGRWKPILSGEPREGIWLRLVNNCRVPIVLSLFDSGSGNAGVQVPDEIVPVLPPWGVAGGLYPGQKPPTPPKRTRVKPPGGYPTPEVSSTETIPPGESLLLSFPFNHVSPYWYMRIIFNLDVSRASPGSVPYCVLEFEWQDIPAGVRADLRPLE